MAFIMINLKVVGTIVDHKHQITALALASSFRSLVSIAFQFMSGKVIDLLSYNTFYSILFGFACAGLVFSIFYRIESGNDIGMFD